MNGIELIYSLSKMEKKPSKNWEMYHLFGYSILDGRRFYSPSVQET